MGKGRDSVVMCSTKFIDMKESGKTIPSQVRANSSEMVSCFLKESFNMGSNMVWGSTGMRMGTFFREITSRMKNVERESIISTKAASLSLSLILAPLRFPKFNSPTEPFMLDNRKTVRGKVRARQLMWMVAFMRDNGKTI